MDDAPRQSGPERRQHQSQSRRSGGLVASTIRDEDSFGLSRGQMAMMEHEIHKLAEARRDDKNLLPVPASQPLIANDMAIFRTLQNVQAVDLRTGETRWKTAHADAVLRPVLSHVNPQPEQFVPNPNGLPNNQTPSALERFLVQRVWRDATFGTLSSDPQRVYSVEDVGMTDGRALCHQRPARSAHAQALQQTDGLRTEHRPGGMGSRRAAGAE